MSKRQASRSPSPPVKLQRAPTPPPEGGLICTLPPTCSRNPARVADAQAMERHYKTYHTYVCQDEGCYCVFPDDRLLELHFAECHDPIIAIRKERGEKTFACHIPTCIRTFATPATRRMHLISVHHYPKEYFFAVTNKGIGGLLDKWGEGASLIRPEWKARSEKSGSELDAKVSSVESSSRGKSKSKQSRFGRQGSHHMSFSLPPEDPPDLQLDDMDQEAASDIDSSAQALNLLKGKGKSVPSTILSLSPVLQFGTAISDQKVDIEDETVAEDESPLPSANTNTQTPIPDSSTVSQLRPGSGRTPVAYLPPDPRNPLPARGSDADLDDLTTQMSNTSLVPRTIRFGRGQHKAGFSRARTGWYRGHAPTGSRQKDGQEDSEPMAIEVE